MGATTPGLRLQPCQWSVISLPRAPVARAERCVAAVSVGRWHTDPATRTPDRIAADVLLAKADRLERNGERGEARELRQRATQLLGDMTVLSATSATSQPSTRIQRVVHRVLSVHGR